MENKTRFIGGVEVDADVARTILNDVLPAVTRVTEHYVQKGHPAEAVRERAKTTAETVVGVISDLLKSKA